jgi:hypothetical protein
MLAEDLTQELLESLGGKRVALSFNPNENMLVRETKVTYANEINRLQMLRKDINGNDASAERNRTISRAQTYAEDACMLSVKCLFQ